MGRTMPNSLRTLLALIAFGLVVPAFPGASLIPGGDRIVATAYAQARPAPPRLNDSRRERIRSGERLIYAEVGEMNRAEAIGLIDVPLADVIEILRDYPNYVHWYPSQRSAELLSIDGLRATARGELGMPFPFPNRHYTVEVNGRPIQHEGRNAVEVTWQYVEGSGNLREMHGFWFLQEWEEDVNKTLARYVLYVDLGTWLPDGVIRWGQRRMLPGIFDGIESWHRQRG
ncbi:MAG: hypothetical protein EA398_09355 [Deltaproteobacteria bacterium]|nr:MAG: hypothetical protein EA398_09355 [Deltaproteobacteria bacterium]